MNGFLTCLISNVVLAGGLAVVALFITKVWRNPHLARALWLFVLVKLVTPPVIHVPLLDLGLAASGNVSAESPGTVPSRVNGAGSDVGSIASENGFSEPPTSVSSEVGRPRRLTSDEPLDASTEEAADPVHSASWHLLTANWPLFLLIAWSAGALTFAVVVLRRHSRMLRLIGESTNADDLLIAEAKALAQQIGLSRCPSLRVTPARISPMAFVSWRTQVILLPRELLDELDGAQVKSVLAHELTHIRRRDHLVRCFETLVLFLHWWNPIAWLASRRLRSAEEGG